MLGLVLVGGAGFWVGDCRVRGLGSIVSLLLSRVGSLHC